MSDEFNRPEWWGQSRLFNEMIKGERDERPPESPPRNPPEDIPLGRTVFGGPVGYVQEELFPYIHSGEDDLRAPWQSPLYLDKGGLERSVTTNGKPIDWYHYKSPVDTRDMPFMMLKHGLHGSNPFERTGYTPRTDTIKHVEKTRPLGWEDEASKRLFVEKHGLEAWENIKKPKPGSPDAYATDGFVYLAKEQPKGESAPRGIIAMHEQEHAVPQREIKTPMAYTGRRSLVRAVKSAANEIPATIGDIANVAAAYRAKHNLPLDVDVKFPGGVQNADMMAQWAYEHGYNQPEGPSMSELIYGTPEGRQWLKMVAGDN